MLSQFNTQNSKTAMEEFVQKIQEDKIADYQHWSVHLDIKQYYLGRVFIWAKRVDAINLLDLTGDELLEMHSILKDIDHKEIVVLHQQSNYVQVSGTRTLCYMKST